MYDNTITSSSLHYFTTPGFVSLTIIAVLLMGTLSARVSTFANAAECVSYSSSSNTITISCDATFSDISGAITDASVLENLGNGEYLLKAHIEVNDGATLQINSATDGITYLKVTGAHGITVHGRIEITGIKITSWDTATGAAIQQDDKGSVSRTFINLRESEGGFIKDSEVGYIGYANPSSRGIDLGAGGGPSHDFEIRNSKIHNNWMGFYSAGAYNIVIDGSEFYDNIKYAMDPHTGTSDMVVSNNHVYNNEGHALICSLNCSNIIFEGNEVHDNNGVGLFFSRATTNSIMRNNVVYNQGGEAYPISISISESQNNQIYGNTISDSKYGISVHNPSPPDDDGVSTGNVIHDNTFDNVQYAIRASASADNTFASNTFETIHLQHFIMSSSADIKIENQIFSNTHIRGTSGNNVVTIQNSGMIEVDGVSYDTDSNPFTATLSSETITVNTITNDSETEPEPIDTEAPSVEITEPPGDASVSLGALVVNGTASDNENGTGVKVVEVRVDSGSYVTATPVEEDWSQWSVEVNIETEGQHRILARATDNFGNQAWNSIYVYGGEKTDDTAPTVTITSPEEGDALLAGTVHVEGTAADNDGGSGIKVVEVRVDGNSYQTATPAAEGDWSTWSIDLEFPETDTYRILARATDNAGNQDWHSVNINIVEEGFTPDETPPEVTITEPSEGEAFEPGSVNVQGTAADADSGVKIVEVRVNDGSYATAAPAASDDWSTWSISLDISDTGTHRILARATDNSGNQDWYSVNIQIVEEGQTADTTSPSVAITDPTDGQQQLPGSIPVTGTASDDSSGVKLVEVRVDDGSYQTATPQAPSDWSEWSITIDITEEGSYRILSRATDNAGNQAWHSVNIHIAEEGSTPDTNSPSVQITSPASGETLPVGNVAVAGTASDNDGGSGVKTVEVRVHQWVNGTLGDLYIGYQTATPNSSGDWSSWSIDLSIPDEGTYRIQARATDNAGNQSWNSIFVTME